MNATAYAEFRAAEGARLNEIAADAERSPNGVGQAGPSCGDWTLEALIAHCATVWTFVAQQHLSRSARSTQPPSPSLPVPCRSGMHADAFSALTDLMTERAPDAEAWTWDPDQQSMSFWWRRMAHEATMHRWDAEAALGITPAPIAPELAVDGVDELFDVYARPATAGRFRRQRRDPAPPRHRRGRRMGHHPHSRRDAGGTCAREVRRRCPRPAQDLLLFVWGRIGPERLETFGRTDLLDEWQRDVRF